MSSNSAEKEATSWQRSKLRLWSGGIIEVRVREALPCLPPSFPLLPSFHSLLQQAHFTTSTSLTFYNFYVSHILQLLRLFSLYPSLPSSFPLLLPCPAHPPFLLPQRPQSSIPSEGRQQDTPSRSLAGKGQGQLMWLCVYTEREGAHAW